MSQDIKITAEPGFVRITYRGDVQYDATTQMLRNVGQLAARTQATRMLFDIREANYRDYHLGTVRHVEEAGALGIQRTFRIAIVGAEGNPMLQYIEAVALNRGYWVKAFTDESPAVSWLGSTS
jgi:hypothetical protein